MLIGRFFLYVPLLSWSGTQLRHQALVHACIVERGQQQRAGGGVARFGEGDGVEACCVLWWRRLTCEWWEGV